MYPIMFHTCKIILLLVDDYEKKIDTNNFLERISTSPLMKDFHFLVYHKNICFTLIYSKKLHPHYKT